MNAFLGDVARAALPVTIVLLLLAAAARAVLWARVKEPGVERVAREHLEPLTTWCVIAVIVDVIALGGAARMDVVSLGVPLLVAAGAVALRPAAESPDAAPEAPEPAEPPASQPRDEDGRPATGLWSR